MTPMLDELDAYYRGRGIHSMEFRCSCRGNCASKVPAEGWFTEAKSTFVGTHYEDATARLLFLASDPGEGREWPCGEQRSPAAIRKKIESDPPGDNPHWWGTLRLALRILSGFDSGICQLWNGIQEQVDSKDCRTWGPSLLKQWGTDFQKRVIPCFAQSNATRCSVNALLNREADDALYSNCQQYLSGEIKVLKPSIIVTQSDRARAALTSCVEVIGNGSECQCQGGCKPPRGKRSCTETCKIVRLSNGDKALWIETYHPGQGAGLFAKEGGVSWNCYTAAAASFMKQVLPELVFTSCAVLRPGVSEDAQPP